jgi:hypothetical protein
MSEAVGQMAELQDELVTQLKKAQFFAPMPIITEKQKDIENEIDRALGSLGGVCVIVLTPRANVSHTNLPGPHFDDVAVVVRIIENVLVNQSEAGTKIPASAVAEQVAANLHHLHTASNKIVLCQQLGLVADPDNLIYDVTFKTKFGVSKQG